MRAELFMAIAAALALGAPAATAKVLVFGDSNVDSGWYKITPYSGDATFDAYLANPAYGVGKPTNNPGSMSVEVLAEQLRQPAARPANQGGTNFATSGAKNVALNTPANGGFPNAVPTVTQLTNFLNNVATLFVPPDDLFVIASGANDVGYAVTQLSGSSQTTYITEQASALAEMIAKLHDHGAKQIIVADLPASFGTAPEMAARELYNKTLVQALMQLNVAFALGDVNRVRKDIVANPTAFRMQFTDNLAGHTACPMPSSGLNITTAWALLCSSNSPVSVPTSFAQNTLFADDQHWASGAQQILGYYYYCLVGVFWPQLLPRLPPLQHNRLPVPCNAFSEFRRRPGL